MITALFFSHCTETAVDTVPTITFVVDEEDSPDPAILVIERDMNLAEIIGGYNQPLIKVKVESVD